MFLFFEELHKFLSASLLTKLGLLTTFFLGLFRTADAEMDYDSVNTPSDPQWLQVVDLSQVPNLPVRPVGSGVCPNSACDGSDNDLCFESCGNDPAPDDIFGCPEDHQWALTFDDGPSNYTLDLLNLLAKEDVKATFCVMGAHVEQYPDILKKIYEAGHQIASHTYSHPHLMSLTNDEIINEVKATEKAIEKVIGIRPRYIRPPFGEADRRVKALFKAMGYKMLLWNVDPTDYDVYMLRDASSKIQGSFRMAAQGNDTGLNLHEDSGFISLQHDLYKESIDQVPKVIQYLKFHGYKFSTAAKCIKDDNPHLVTNLSVAAVKSGTVHPSSPFAQAASPFASASMSHSLAKFVSSSSSARVSKPSTNGRAKKVVSDSTKRVVNYGRIISASALALYVAHRLVR